MIPLLPGLGIDPGEVTETELVRVRLPLVRPHRAAHGTEAERDVVLVRVTLADGVVGWGECSALSRPTYTAEHTAGAWLVLAQELLPAVVAGRTAAVVGHPLAKAAVEAAITDALLRRAGRSLVETFAAAMAREGDGPGPAPVQAVPVTVVVGRGESVDDVVGAVARARSAGAALVKCKVTPDPADLAAVAEVRATWPDLALAVDWNQSADVAALAALADLDLAYVEQPGPADDLVTCARLAERAGAPVALDESIDGIGTLSTAVALRSGSVLNLKPARVGGLAVALDLLAAARAAGWDVLVGGMLETGVGRAAALAVAAQPDMAFPTDLGPSKRYFERDVTAPVDVDADGRVVVPDGPGIGRTVDAGAVEAFTVERATFAASHPGLTDR